MTPNATVAPITSSHRLKLVEVAGGGRLDVVVVL